MPIIDVDEKTVHDLVSQGNNVILKFYAPVVKRNHFNSSGVIIASVLLQYFSRL